MFDPASENSSEAVIILLPFSICCATLKVHHLTIVYYLLDKVCAIPFLVKAQASFSYALTGIMSC